MRISLLRLTPRLPHHHRMSHTPWLTLKSKLIRLNNQQLISLSPLNRNLSPNSISFLAESEGPSKTTTPNDRHDICPLHTDTNSLTEAEATVVRYGWKLGEGFLVSWVGGRHPSGGIEAFRVGIEGGVAGESPA